MKMKILFLHHKYGRLSPYLPMGGAASCAIEMAEWLHDSGAEVTVAAILPEEKNFHHNGIAYVHLGQEYDLDLHLPTLSSKDFDVVEVLRGNCLEKVAKYFPNAKRVLRLIDVFFESHESTAAQVNQYLDRACAVSEYVRSRALNWGISREKLCIVPVGVRTDIFRPLPEIKREENLLVFSGATLPEKGIHLLLNAFASILSSPLDYIRLEIYGSADLWSRKEVFNWEKVSEKFPNIIYMGARSKRELAEALNRAALCIVPSLVPEGFTRASIEAQACGCPVICSGQGGLPETVLNGITGYVFMEPTSRNLEVALLNLIPDKERLHKMSDRAAKHGERFSVENAGNVFMNMIDDLLAPE